MSEHRHGARTPAPSDAPPSRLSTVKVTGQALAAVTTAGVGAVVGGAGGTVAGAALASVVTTVGEAFYQRSLERTRDRVRGSSRGAAPRRVPPDSSNPLRTGPPVDYPPSGQQHAPLRSITEPETVAYGRARGDGRIMTGAGMPGRHGSGPAGRGPSEPPTEAFPPPGDAAPTRATPSGGPSHPGTRVMPGTGDSGGYSAVPPRWSQSDTGSNRRPGPYADEPGDADEPGYYADEEDHGYGQGPDAGSPMGHPPEETPRDRRRPGWKRWAVLAATAVLVFAVAMVAVTVIERVKGSPLSGGGPGTSIGKAFGDDPSSSAPPTSSQEPAEPASTGAAHPPPSAPHHTGATTAPPRSNPAKPSPSASHGPGPTS